MKPGPVRIALDNRSRRRILPAIWQLKATTSTPVFANRRPYLDGDAGCSANQTFPRDLSQAARWTASSASRSPNLNVPVHDLRGSTALYDRVGDLAAYDLVRSHFGALISAVSAEGGAVVKTIGDAVMATFSTA